MKKIVILLIISLWSSMLLAQQADNVPKKFVATSEKEMYQLLEKMIDSTLIEKKNHHQSENRFGDYFEASLSIFSDYISNKDTLLIFVQDCDENKTVENKCNNKYYASISESMPIAFYERLLNYLDGLRKSDNYHKIMYSFEPLYNIRDILIKQYESNILNKTDSKKVLDLIEKISLISIKEEHYYGYLRADEAKPSEYMTPKIREALVNAIENPYYPKDFLNSYMLLQDTTFLDITNIPDSIKIMHKKKPQIMTEYSTKLSTYNWYQELGKYKYNGLSAGQAYLEEKRKTFSLQGYSGIEDIARYAYMHNDTLLIKYLNEFKKKHPDYKVRYYRTMWGK